VAIFYESLQSCLASNTAAVRNDAESIIGNFTMNLDTLIIVVPLCKAAEYGMQKSKPFLIQ